MHKSITSGNSLKEFSANMLVDFDVRGQQRMDFYTE